MNDYWDALRSVFSGRKVICVGEVSASFALTVDQLYRLGASEVLVASFGHGTGPQPKNATIAILPSGARPKTSMESIRAEHAALSNPSPDLLAVIDAFDDDRTAVLVSHFLNCVPTLDGRPFLSYRRPEWLALEDKSVIDEFWDRIGVRRSVSKTTRVDPYHLQVASIEMANDAGVVWSGDARDGFNGGGEYVRWLRDESDLESATKYFAPRCDLVRVMPFLEGIPCSVHGIVFDNSVAVLRPVEMVVLRRTEPHEKGPLLYAGCASFYDPPDEVRAEMRELARRVGSALRAEVGFHGAFTVDGVATAAGFLPTELNPRMGAGLSVILGGLSDLPIQLLLDALVGGVALDIDPVEFEAELLEAADRDRAGGTWMSIPGVTLPDAMRPAVFSSRVWRWASDAEPADATITTGPSVLGSFVRFRFSGSRTPVGPSVGERAAAAWAFVDSEFGTGIGRLTAAPDVC